MPSPSKAPIPEDAVAARVHPPKTFGGKVRLPGSKSITNRALLIAGLASGRTTLRNFLDCDDSRYLADALERLGVPVTRNPEASVVTVAGSGGPFPVKSGEFFLGNAGTATRFLTAALATAGGTYRVDGDERMRQRPIAELVRALNILGADVRAPTGCPPVDIGPRPLYGGRVDISGAVSSQYISAILMAAPFARERVQVRIEGEPVSRPYIDLTVGVMRAFGARVWADDRRADGQPVFEVQPGRGYRAREDYTIEGDASTASYFYAAAAVTGGTVRVEGVGRESLQGDVRVADILADMGCRVKKEEDAITVTGDLLRGVDCDMSDMPDVVPTLAVTALFARGRTRLRRVPHLRFKESDRLKAIAAGIEALGGRVRELRDGLEVEGTLGLRESPLHPAAIETFNDHRMAMAFSIAGLALEGVEILDPQVVTKSFPGFFQALAALGAPVEFRLASGEIVPVEGGASP